MIGESKERFARYPDVAQQWEHYDALRRLILHLTVECRSVLSCNADSNNAALRMSLRSQDEWFISVHSRSVKYYGAAEPF